MEHLLSSKSDVLHLEKQKKPNPETQTLQHANQFVMCHPLFLLKTLYSRGFADLLDAMHLSSIAEWLTTRTVEKKKKKKRKTKRRKTALFLCPHRSAGILCL